MSFGDELQTYTYEHLLQEALARVPGTVDRREGSIIYDAIAPACYVLAEYYMVMYQLIQETYVLTATGENLELRCAEQGITREQASPAVKKAIFTKSDGSPASVALGSRFATFSEEVPLYYTLTGEYRDADGNVVAGTYQATCETPGVAGHQYTGNILPLDYLPNIAEAVLADTIIPGTDLETDDELRARYLLRVNTKAFAGNIAHYREMVLGLDGGTIGGVQVYPTWNGGGTVKLSIIDSTYLPVSLDYLRIVQQQIDPDADPSYSGQGLGLAPIDHRVTVTTPDRVECSVACDVVLAGGYSVSQVQAEAAKALDAYFLTLRRAWGQGNELNQYSMAVYASQIIRTILSVEGVANATNVTINGSANDLILTENGTVQQLPVFKEVVLNA